MDVPGALAVNGITVQTPSASSAMTSLMIVFLCCFLWGVLSPTCVALELRSMRNCQE